jgi:hypothetical protein
MSFNWIITSSTDPTKVSLFIKGILVGLAPLLMIAFGITEEQWTPIVDQAVQLAYFVSAAISAGMMLWGMGRKLYEGHWSHPDASQ